MKLCWGATPEQRPVFTVVINKLTSCLDDAEVTNAPLPVFQHSLDVDHSNVTSNPSYSNFHPENNVNSDVTGGSNSAQSRFGPATPNSLQPLLTSTSSATPSDVTHFPSRDRPNSRDSDVFLFDNDVTVDSTPAHPQLSVASGDAFDVATRRANIDSGFVGDASDQSESPPTASQLTSARSSRDYKNLQLHGADVAHNLESDVTVVETPLLKNSRDSAYVNT